MCPYIEIFENRYEGLYIRGLIHLRYTPSHTGECIAIDLARRLESGKTGTIF